MREGTCRNPAILAGREWLTGLVSLPLRLTGRTGLHLVLRWRIAFLYWISWPEGRRGGGGFGSQGSKGASRRATTALYGSLPSSPSPLRVSA